MDSGVLSHHQILVSAGCAYHSGQGLSGAYGRGCQAAPYPLLFQAPLSASQGFSPSIIAGLHANHILSPPCFRVCLTANRKASGVTSQMSADAQCVPQRVLLYFEQRK